MRAGKHQQTRPTRVGGRGSHSGSLRGTRQARPMGRAVWRAVPIIIASPTRELSVPVASASPSPSQNAVAEAIDELNVQMREVDAVIARRLSSDVALINQISGYIVHAGGKRMRPKLVLLFANALGYTAPARFELAATVEFIHTATLLHDDVVDESALRRGKQTANAMFGNAASVLVGDFLYSRAFQMMVSVERMRILEVLADATNVIAEGEVLQLMNMHDPDITVESYLRVIRFKTAKLFEASARIGAVLADASAEVEDACAAYGRALGTAFQLIDDVLDYEGDAHTLGKNIGDDLREGKATLPLLIAMERGTSEQRALIRHAIQHGEQERLAEIVEIVRSTGALEATREAARIEARLARDCLNHLPSNKWQKSLLEFAAQSVERSF
jgi:octaprenyl-diphosphate synthase